MQSLEEIYKMYSKRVFLFLLSKTNAEQLSEELFRLFNVLNVLKVIVLF